MTQPLVTVCIPVYNGATFIDACLDAVSAQHYRHLEILVVDNHSTDGTAARARRRSRRDPRIRVVVNARNIGLVRNRNRALAQARGEWIKFMDIDDRLEPDAIGRLLEAAAPGYRMAACRRRFHYDGVDERQRDTMESEVRRFELRELLPGRRAITAAEVARLAIDYRGRNFVGEPTAVLIHRSVYEEFGGFNEDLVQIPDLEYWLRVGVHTGIAYVDEPLATYRIHDGAASAANQSLRSFRADRVDQLILLHEYLYHPQFEPLRLLAEAEGRLEELRAEFRRQTLRVAVRAALDRQSRNPLVREHWGAWHILTTRHGRLRPRGDALLPLAAFALRASGVRR